MQRQTLLKIIQLVCIGVFIFAAVSIIIAIRQYKKADDIYQNLQQNYVETIPQTPTSDGNSDLTDPTDPTRPTDPTDPAEPTAPTKPTDPTVSTDPTLPTDPTTPTVPDETVPTEPTSPPVSDKYTTPITVDFDALLKLNDDIVGWLYSPGTVINYPVAQGENNAKYLHADIYGNYLKSGTLFVDFRNKKIGEDNNYLIYGHNMENGSMFGSLISYHSYYYYADHPVIYYLTPEQNYAIELYIGAVVKSNANIYLPTATASEIRAILAELKEKTTFVSDITINENDTFVTLSTCSYEFADARYVVIGRVIPIK